MNIKKREMEDTKRSNWNFKNEKLQHLETSLQGWEDNMSTSL